MTVTPPLGQTFVLTKGVDSFTGGTANNTIIAGSSTLTSGDQIDGGSGGNNALDLTTSGSFNLQLPTTLTDIQIVNAQEGQAAYSNTTQSFVATNQVVTLRSGLNVTVNVAGALINPLNPKAATITIIGANDASVINLAGGNDVVTLGSAAETVHGGSGNNQIQVTASTIGATIDGGTGQSTLAVLGGGSVVMGSNVTDISNVLLASTPSAMSFTANSTAGLVVNDASKGADTVTAGGLNQTLTGGAGKDTFVGFSGGSTTFADLAAAISGDVINNFRAPGDTIDFTDVSFASLSFNFAENSGGTAGVMTVSDGTHTAAVTLGGSFSPGSFHQTALGSGTIITYS